METIAKKHTIKSINPATNELLREFEVTSAEQLEVVIAKADQAFKIWKKTSFEERSAILNKAAALMIEKKQFLAELATLEVGKKISESIEEVELAARFYTYYAENAAHFLTDKPIKTPLGNAFLSYEPIGTLLSIQPWNFPYYQVLRVSAPQLMAGNTMILKHASNVPQCAQAMEDILTEAGLPEGVFTNVFMPGSQVGGLMDDPRIKGVMLTGSEKAGASIAIAASKNIKKATLELGGSDPFIVLDDADLDKAVQMAVYGRMYNSGQACASPKRIIVQENIADAFLVKALGLFDKLKVGDPMDPDTDVGPLSSESAVIEVLEQVNEALEEGARLVRGGHRIERKGAYMEPTLLIDITQNMSAYKDEIFGPVFMLYTVKDDQEAIDLANATDFGLGCSIYASQDRAIKVGHQIDSGMVFINQLTSATPELPYGGTKNSGYGREQSEAGIHEFVNAKIMVIAKK
jgi:succinate-semialdehyde dehydrogenase/glutarate-semialdehyde dehydrogenase